MIEIYKAELKHANILAEVGKNTFLESHGHSASKEDIDSYVNKNFNNSSFKKELQNPDNIYHIISVNNKVAGYSKIVLNIENVNVAAQNITKLERLYLLKEFHGLNLGSKLFDFNVSLSKKKHQKGLWLAVWVENFRAISFYTKTGFKIVGTYDFKISEKHANPNHIMYLNY